jgi:hypothetical protein
MDGCFLHMRLMAKIVIYYNLCDKPEERAIGRKKSDEKTEWTKNRMVRKSSERNAGRMGRRTVNRTINRMHNQLGEKNR